MPKAEHRIPHDPLAAFMTGAFTTDEKRPVPLVSTTFAVSIDSGFATVVSKRVFRNDEAGSIEATMTFPVPVHAALFALSVQMDGRVLRAQAQRNDAARETYEDAIERGKLSVLHEEVLRGVHMLSIGHLAPGAEIEVSTSWAATLTYVDGHGQLRIPLTVGDIYGPSGLADSDELVHGGPAAMAKLVVRCPDGVVEVRGQPLVDGRATIPLSAPIDLVVTQAVHRVVRGVAADGRDVSLHIQPCAASPAALTVAVLVDRSGSMAERCSDATGPITKHDAIIAGLGVLAGGLAAADSVDLWEFGDDLRHLGSTLSPGRGGRLPIVQSVKPRDRLSALIGRLSPPQGGTEIGWALDAAMAGSEMRDVLLITDGKSHALDVQALARRGRRVTVVLVGEDSLEANVGHLAAATGGEIFVCAGSTLGATMIAAFASLRAPWEHPSHSGGNLQGLRCRRGGAVLEAEWRAASDRPEDGMQARAVAAFAAALALPGLTREAAATLAEAEQLVTHLTSLVMVDEDSQSQESLPATRKIALPTPRTAAAPLYRSRPSPPLMGMAQRPSSPAGAPDRAAKAPAEFNRLRRLLQIISRHAAGRPDRSVDLSTVGRRIDWDDAPNRLLAGDLSTLDGERADLIREAASLPQAVALARSLKISPVVLILALLARGEATRNRSAARIATLIFGKKASASIDSLEWILGLIKK